MTMSATLSPAHLDAAARLVASGDSAFGAGMIAFLVVLALCVGSYFLFRSMNRHLRKVPKSFDPPPQEQEQR
jgi:hypothetical protein